MVDGHGERPNRLERRKQRTRAALIKAAQAFIAAGKPNVPVLDITQAADVGMGSFYNHFDSKEQLFQAAVTDVFDAYGAVLDSLPEVDDPAETFARSFRLAGRFFRLRPQECRVLLNVGIGPILSDRGLAPRALRDIIAANRAGRFHVADPNSRWPWPPERCWPWANCCKTSPGVTTRRPATRWPKTCCASSGYRPRRPARSAADPSRHCRHHRGGSAA